MRNNTFEPTKYDYSPLMNKIGKQDCMIHYSSSFISDVREIYEANNVSYDKAYYPLITDLVLYGVILGKKAERTNHIALKREQASKQGNNKATAPNAR